MSATATPNNANAPRQTREQETRAAEERRPWRPLDNYPVPVVPGLRFRWIRTMILGQPDRSNVAYRFREGWTPVKASDFPELMMRSERHSEFPDCIEIAGLLLCSLPQLTADERNAYFRAKTEAETTSLDRMLQSQNDPGHKEHGMKFLPSTRLSRVATGKSAAGSAED